MTTNELIAKLRKIDPGGEMTVFTPGRESYGYWTASVFRIRLAVRPQHGDTLSGYDAWDQFNDIGRMGVQAIVVTHRKS